MKSEFVKIKRTDLASIMPSLDLCDFSIIKPFIDGILFSENMCDAILALDYIERCSAIDFRESILKLIITNLDERAYVSIDVLCKLIGVAEVEKSLRDCELAPDLDAQVSAYMFIYGKSREADFVSRLNLLKLRDMNRVAWKISRILVINKKGRLLLTKLDLIVPKWSKSIALGGERSFRL